MDKAAELVEYILNYIRENGYQPSSREMSDKLQVKGGVTYFLRKAEKDGVIRLTNKDRAIIFPGMRWVEEREKGWDIGGAEGTLLDILRQFICANGYQPTVNELADLSGVSRITVMKRIQKLSEMGAVVNTGSRRAIRLVGSKWDVVRG